MADSAQVWSPRDAIPTVGTYSSIVKERFVAVASQQAFAISNFGYTPGTEDVLVYKNGALLVPTYDYIETNSTTITLTVGAASGDVLLIVGFLGYINAAVDPYYLGPKAAAPTLDNQGVTLGASHEGYTYWNTTSGNFWIWSGTVWGLQAASVATSANLVSIADAGSKFVGIEVETALQECVTSTFLASTAVGKGASSVGIEDAAGNFTGTNVEAALLETANLTTKLDTPNGTGVVSKALILDASGLVQLPKGTLIRAAGESTTLTADGTSIAITPTSLIDNIPIEMTLFGALEPSLSVISFEINGDTTAGAYNTSITADSAAPTISTGSSILLSAAASSRMILSLKLVPNTTMNLTLIEFTANVFTSTSAMVLYSGLLSYTGSGAVTSIKIKSTSNLLAGSMLHVTQN